MQPEKKSFADTIKAKPGAVSAPVEVKTAGTQTFADADRKRGGRPKKTDAEKGTKTRVVIYFTDDEMRSFQDAAKKFGMSVTGFIKVAGFEKLQAIK